LLASNVALLMKNNMLFFYENIMYIKVGRHVRYMSKVFFFLPPERYRAVEARISPEK
jgi:hypothetical protein